MRLIEDWEWVVHNSWSMRVLILANVLTGAEVAMSVFIAEPPIPRGLFAVLAFFLTISASVARLVAQRDQS